MNDIFLLTVIVVIYLFMIASLGYYGYRQTKNALDYTSGCGLAVGSGDPDYPVRRQIGPGNREQFNIANHRHAKAGGMGGDCAVAHVHAPA